MAKPRSPTLSSDSSDYSRHERFASGLPIVLRVQVLSCCDLPAADSNGKSDPWVVLLGILPLLRTHTAFWATRYVIIKFGDQVKRTRVINETLDPVYGSDAIFDIYISEDDVKAKGALLHLTVMDKDLIRGKYGIT